MPRLGVNIDHVATLRQVRGGREPDPVWAAVLAELGGGDVITIHLREDRRHIQERDLRLLRQTVQVRLNMELAVEPGVIALALEVKPDQATFVPERREELTTEGGLDVAGQRDRVAEALARCRDAGIDVALFIDPDPRQVEAAVELGASRGRAAHRALRQRPPRGPIAAASSTLSRPRPSPPSPPGWNSTPATASITRTSRPSRGSTAWKSSTSATASSAAPSSSASPRRSVR